MKKAIIILPTYNEKGNIEKIIDVLEQDVLPGIKTYDMHILVADDHSPDGTADIVKDLMEKHKNLYLVEGEKEGLGAAYIRAMTYAIEKLDATVMFEMDADFFHDPKKIPAFLQKRDDGADFVLGTRYSSGGSIPKNWGLHTKIFSIFGNLLVRTILMRFSVHDWTGGYRAIRKEVFLKEREKLRGFKGYTFQVAFLLSVLQDGYKVAEVPFHAVDRVMGRSKIAPLEYIFNLLKYVITARVKELLFGKFGKFLVIGGVGFLIQATGLRILVEGYKWHPAAANLATAAVAIFSNFNFNNMWTFKETKAKSMNEYLAKLFGFYASSSIGVILIQTGIIFLGTHTIGERYYFWYFLFGTALLLIWNFTMYSKVIWKKKTAS